MVDKELTEKEQALYDKFLEKREISPNELDNTEVGCIGRLKSKGLIEKTRVAAEATVSGSKVKTVWKLKSGCGCAK